jgi:hypothetical protein
MLDGMKLAQAQQIVKLLDGQTLFALTALLLVGCGKPQAQTPVTNTGTTAPTVTAPAATETPVITYCPMTSGNLSELTGYCVHNSPGVYSGGYQACVCRGRWIYRNYTCSELSGGFEGYMSQARYRSGC